jgi:hypothetical protein
VGGLSAMPAMARVCLTDSGRRTCATGMPVDGYCMCGDEGGTVMPDGYRMTSRRPMPPPEQPPPDQPPPYQAPPTMPPPYPPPR